MDVEIVYYSIVGVCVKKCQITKKGNNLWSNISVIKGKDTFSGGFVRINTVACMWLNYRTDWHWTLSSVTFIWIFIFDNTV